MGILAQKLYTSFLSSIVMGMACSIIFFRGDDFAQFAFVGGMIFLFIYCIIGAPTSFLLDLLAQRIKKSGIPKILLIIFMYIIGGVIATILYFMLALKTNIYQLFDTEMFFFYALGISGSLLFLIIETSLKKLFK